LPVGPATVTFHLALNILSLIDLHHAANPATVATTPRGVMPEEAGTYDAQALRYVMEVVMVQTYPSRRNARRGGSL